MFIISTTRPKQSRIRAGVKSLVLLAILLLIPYRIASGTSPNAVHTWFISLFWQIHFDRISSTIHFTTQIVIIMFFLLITFPALYFITTLQRRSDNTFPKIPLILSIFAPFVLDFCISMEDEITLPFSLSRYEWQTLYAFSLVILVAMILIPLFVKRLPSTRNQPSSRFLRLKIEAVIAAISTVALPSVVVGMGRMFTHYTYDEMVFYSPLWSLLFWERSGAFYGADELVFEFYTIPSLIIAFFSSFFNLAFVFLLFHNYGQLKTRKRTLIIGIIGTVSMTLSYYLMEFFSSDIQRVYILTFPIPVTLIVGLLIMKYSYPKYESSTPSELREVTSDDLQQVESDDVLEISIAYRLLSWLRKRM